MLLGFDWQKSRKVLDSVVLISLKSPYEGHRGPQLYSTWIVIIGEGKDALSAGVYILFQTLRAIGNDRPFMFGEKW